MRTANQNDISEAQMAALSVEGGFQAFYDLRDWLDKRFPEVSFSLEEEEEVWFCIPNKT